MDVYFRLGRAGPFRWSYGYFDTLDLMADESLQFCGLDSRRLKVRYHFLKPESRLLAVIVDVLSRDVPMFMTAMALHANKLKNCEPNVLDDMERGQLWMDDSLEVKLEHFTKK